MIRLTLLLLFALPTPAFAQDRLPQPDYHRQPGDPEWLVQVVQFHGHLGPSVVAGARMGKGTLTSVQADQIVVRVRNTHTGKTAELRPTSGLVDLLTAFRSGNAPGPGAQGVGAHGPAEQDHERLESIARKIAGMEHGEIATVTMEAMTK